MVGAIPTLKAYFGAVVLIKRVNERELIRLARKLAMQTRREIDQAGLELDDFEGIAQKYSITLSWARLPKDNPGCYIKEKKKIILDPRVQMSERLHFTFDHELIHDRVENDDEMLSLLADACVESYETTIERLCNAGTAEFLMPSADMHEMIRQHGFSTEIIPTLCDRYNASSLAVAFQMILTATHDCYLVIAEPDYVVPDKLSMLADTQPVEAQLKLIMIYTAASPSAKYFIKRGQIVSADHPISTAWEQKGQVVPCQAKIPFASGKGWDMDFDALYFRSKVFAVFNKSYPSSADQLQLL
jgi:Zn-dependent peptidase ImmA (M78 family)